MTINPRRLRPICLLLPIAFAPAGLRAEDAPPLRPQAVIDLSFDEDAGEAQDRAAAGETRDAGKLQNGALRVASPFWNNKQGRAALLDGTKKQFVEVPHGPDANRPQAATAAFFFLNLVPPDTAEFVGLFAKRSEQAGNVTNYGVNYGMKSDTLQLYVNDGQGYRVARYSIAETLGHRRRAHVAATFEVARAPAADAAKPAADVRMRLFVNGKIVKPAGGGQGVTVDGDDAWATAVEVPKLVNDVPLALGATNAAREHASGLIDEFLLFDRALAPEEIDRLFLEVAGKDAREQAEREAKRSSSPAPPRITGISPRGVQVGVKTQLVITGTNLGPKALVLLPDTEWGGAGAAAGSTAERLIVNVALDSDIASTGFIPLRVQTAAGLSNAVPLAIDSLPQKLAAESSAEKPSDLPGAFTGTLSGAERPRIHFRGKKGDRVAAEVEARRIGAAFDPVVELKTDRGRPLRIAGESIPLRGDARVETKLPADGLYYVELHDLQYRAPANSPFRLLMGDILLIDAFVPNEITEGNLRMVGSGVEGKGEVWFRPYTTLRTDGENRVWLPEMFRPASPPPPVLAPDGEPFVEPTDPSNGPVPVPRTEDPSSPRAIHGQIAAAGERDRFAVSVVPNQKLSLKLRTRSIDSPLHGHIAVASLPDEKPLGNSDGDPAEAEPGLAVTVPEKVERLLVTVRDRYGRGESAYRYRLDVAPGDQPRFSLKVLDSPVMIAADGRALVRLQVERKGHAGRIPLRVSGAGEGSAIQPQEIPPGNENRTQLVVLEGVSIPFGGGFGFGTWHAEISGASVVPTAGDVPVRGFDDQLPVAVMPAAGLKLDVAGEVPPLLKGATIELPLKLERTGAALRETVRLSLVTTEPERPVDPRDPKKGNKPRIDAVPGQTIAPGETEGVLRVTVPNDVEMNEVDLAVRAELVPHAWSDDVRSTTYSLPLRLPVK
ncbi:MAG: hypothetical protein WD069_03230 [Planctomycetales bacterium]